MSWLKMLATAFLMDTAAKNRTAGIALIDGMPGVAPDAAANVYDGLVMWLIGRF